MIQLDQVSRHYVNGTRRVPALSGVSLKIDGGEYVALLGPSGSGKSTLMHVIGCLDRPTAGVYQLDGVDVAGLDSGSLAAIRNRKIGFVFQRFHLMSRLSAWENVALPMRLAGMGLAGRKARAAALLERMGLADRQDHRPHQLSGGEQQRVAVARAVANRPPVILADEPTGNLDSQSGAAIVRLLEEFVAEGHTLVMVTHDLALSRRAGRIVRLKDGCVVRDP
ncbi:MAG: ABC transporter ATP-binding protein [Verrucomicrobiales bacterium]|nr:ABC transporter ATP-binding protein [Verrucomicrobiales bacterium]